MLIKYAHTVNKHLRQLALILTFLFLQPFMGPRYPAGPRPGVRMPQIGNEFNGVSKNS